jgi:hypothetical protein
MDGGKYSSSQDIAVIFAWSTGEGVRASECRLVPPCLQITRSRFNEFNSKLSTSSGPDINKDIHETMFELTW